MTMVIVVMVTCVNVAADAWRACYRYEAPVSGPAACSCR